MVVDKAGFADAPLVDVAPPTYAASESPSASSSSRSPIKTSPLTPHGPPDIPRSNFVTIERPHKKVEGSFVIDPSLTITEDALSPLSSDETEAGRRTNLRLSSAHAGIKTDVWVLDGADVKSTWLVFHSPHSGTDIRIHSVGKAVSKIDITSTHSTSKLQLPRNWQGLIVAERSHGTVKFEPEHHITMLSEVNGTMKCFVGDSSLLAAGPWTGNTLAVKVTHGTLKLRFGNDPSLAAHSDGNKLTKGKDKKKGVKWSWWPSIGFVDDSSDDERK